MNYSEAREYLKNVNKLGSILGLNTIKELLKRLGNPQNELKVVHIAGTNGKGSVGAMLQAVLEEAGLKVGRYSSPAVFSYREIWQINGKAVSEEANKPYLQRIMEKIQRGILLSFVCDQFSYYVELLEEAGIQFTKPQFETFANRLCELNNHSHLWSNCGGQPVEMYDGLDNAELDAAALMKTMQLDPDGYYRNPVLSRITPKKNEDGQD